MLPPTETGNNIFSADFKCIFRLADPVLGQLDARQQITSILFTGDGCFISVFGKADRTYKAFAQYDFGLAEGEIFTSAGYDRYRNAFVSLLNSSEIRSLSAENVRPAFWSDRHTIVPGAYFNADVADHCFSSNYRPINGEVLKSDYIRQADAFLAFGVPPVVADIASEFFPKAALRSTAGLSIDWLLTGTHASREKIMLLDISKSRLKIVVCENNNLLFCNDFEVHTAEDIVYYSVFVANQLGDKDELTVWISGDVTQDSRPHRLLCYYLKNISFVPQPADISFSPAFEGITWHEYFPVLNIALCE
jgi:hypothetical protein